MILRSFPKITKDILKPLPRNDYPALNTFLFVSCWLEYTMDKSVVSMRDLVKRLNIQGIDLQLSTFSKASKKRDTQPFLEILTKLTGQLNQQKGNQNTRALFPKLLDKLRYLQAYMCQEISYVHWFRKLIWLN